jgi:hypothetical protein
LGLKIFPLLHHSNEFFGLFRIPFFVIPDSIRNPSPPRHSGEGRNPGYLFILLLYPARKVRQGFTG